MQNPGKEFFLKLAADSFRDVNRQMYDDGINYARKAMIHYGVSLGLDGRWFEQQLTSELQEIIAQNRPYFDELSIDPAYIETETDSE